MSNYRYTKAEWDYIDRAISGPIHNALSELNRRTGGGFKVPYPCEDEATARAWEELIVPLVDALEQAWRETVDLLDGDNVEVDG
jgi:hypothetical protein